MPIQSGTRWRRAVRTASKRKNWRPLILEFRWETEIRARADEVFALLADLRDYDRWLPKSISYNGTVKISDGPIAVGTTYVERSLFGTRFGRVTAFSRPTRLDFEQPMTSWLSALGVIGIRLSHTLTPDAASVHVLRVLELSPRGPVTLAMPLVVPAFRAENDRIIGHLKEFAERAMPQPPHV